MAALSKFMPQMVTYLHAGSHIKPRRVKTLMQMRAGRKGHKKNKRRSRRMILKWFLKMRLNEKFLLCFYNGLLLQTKIGLRRNGGQFKETGRRELSKGGFD